MKKIIIGITGSIAAFKTIQFISDLTKQDYLIDVILTPSAARFVTADSIQALTKRKVYIDLFDDDPGTITHIDLVKDADAFLVMPASATTVAKLAIGMADNMLTAAFLAATCPKIVAPAMNVHMYQNKATQRNLMVLRNDLIDIVEPVEGLLACGDVGVGKLADYDTIMMRLEYALHDHPLLGQRVLVTAGPTQEALDPVRFITNHSSGKMGYAIARAAYIMGADVTLISGPVSLKKLPYIHTVSITSASDLANAVDVYGPLADYVIMAAAVADYAPSKISAQKIKKNDDSMMLSLSRTKDILAALGQRAKETQVICGFAMESENLIDNAKGKLLKKRCDMIIANSIADEGAGFSHDTNVISFVELSGVTKLPIQSKSALGYIIMEKCIEIRSKKL